MFDHDSDASKADKDKIDRILYNIQEKRGACLLNQQRVSEHPDRTSFAKFIRTAQHKLFNPGRPKNTGTFVIILFVALFNFCYI